MSEKKLVIDNLRLNYKGIFSVNEFYKEIMNWFYERGYDMYEKKNVERITETGRNVELELRPYKQVTGYAKNEVRVRIFMKNINDVEDEKDGVKIRINQGDVEVIFDGYVETDYENRWENKPYFYFLRSLVDKYVWRIYTDKFESMLISDVHHIHTRIKSF